MTIEKLNQEDQELLFKMCAKAEDLLQNKLDLNVSVKIIDDADDAEFIIGQQGQEGDVPEDITALASIEGNHYLLIINPVDVLYLFGSLMHQIGMAATAENGIAGIESTPTEIMEASLWALETLKNDVGLGQKSMLRHYAEYGIRLAQMALHCEEHEEELYANLMYEYEQRSKVFVDMPKELLENVERLNDNLAEMMDYIKEKKGKVTTH